MRQWDPQLHAVLSTEAEELLASYDANVGALNDITESDGWTTDDAKVRRHMSLVGDNNRLKNQIDLNRSKLERLERFKPTGKPRDDGRDLLHRFTFGGRAKMEESERRDQDEAFEIVMADDNLPGEDKLMMQAMQKAGFEAIDLSLVRTPPRPMNPYAAMMALVQSDESAAPSVQPAVQVDVMPEVFQRLDNFGGPMKMCRTISTPGDTRPKKFPNMDDVQVGEIVANQDTAATEQDFGIGSVEFEVHRSSSKYVDIPLEVFWDLGSINLAALIPNMLARRIGRAWDARITTGTANISLWNIVPDNAAHKVTVGNATDHFAFTYDELQTVEYRVDRAYRTMGGESHMSGFRPMGDGQTGYLFHDDVERRLKLLKDTEGRPVWLPQSSSALGMWPGTINNKPYEVAGSAPALSDSNPIILFGNFSYYGVRNAAGPLMFRMMDATTVLKAATRFLMFAWMGVEPLTPQYGTNMRYEWLTQLEANS